MTALVEGISRWSEMYSSVAILAQAKNRQPEFFLARAMPSSLVETMQLLRSWANQQHEMVTVRDFAFGDKHPVKIAVYDTPGLGDTGGHEADEKQWNSMMRALENGVHEVDAVVWIMNALVTRGVEARKMMLRSMRLAFGVKFYRHLTMLFNFFPYSQNRTYNKLALEI